MQIQRGFKVNLEVKGVEAQKRESWRKNLEVPSFSTRQFKVILHNKVPKVELIGLEAFVLLII